jgi:diguanylate cyclase (GGDEF)-like protein/PAS domain S-box-containing protein
VTAARREQYKASLAGILDELPERVIRYWVPDLTIDYCNLAWATEFGLAPADVIGRKVSDFLTHPEVCVLREHLALLTPANLIIINGAHAANDTGRWVDWVDQFLPGKEGGDGDAVLAVGRDATERHVAEMRLIESEARFRELTDRSTDIVWRLRSDPTPHFEYVSPAVEHILGCTPDWLIGDFNRFVDLLQDDGRATVMDAIVGGLPIPRTDLRFRHSDGRTVIGETMANPTRDGLQGITRDVTELRELQLSLAALAYRDPLTGLANRRLLDELLALALTRARVSGRRVSVLFLDLDCFKAVNDTHGHEVGDIVLPETARRLLDVVRSSDTVARLGGDEFVIICDRDQAGARSLVARIDRALSVPIAISATESVCCPASIGIADSASTGTDAADLLAAADLAMYEVKKSRRPATALIV